MSWEADVETDTAIDNLRREGIYRWPGRAMSDRDVGELNDELMKSPIFASHVAAKATESSQPFLKVATGVNHQWMWPIFSNHMHDLIRAPHWFELALSFYPMAEAYFRHLAEKAKLRGVTVSSAGTFTSSGTGASQASIAVMKKYGIDISTHKSSSLGADIIGKADLIVAMTQAHRIHVGSIDSSALRKTRLLLEYADRIGEDISDPFGTDKNVYSLCFEEMKPALDNLFLDIKNKTKGSNK